MSSLSLLISLMHPWLIKLLTSYKKHTLLLYVIFQLCVEQCFSALSVWTLSVFSPSSITTPGCCCTSSPSCWSSASSSWTCLSVWWWRTSTSAVSIRRWRRLGGGRRSGWSVWRRGGAVRAFWRSLNVSLVSHLFSLLLHLSSSLWLSYVIIIHLPVSSAALTRLSLVFVLVLLLLRSWVTFISADPIVSSSSFHPSSHPHLHPSIISPSFTSIHHLTLIYIHPSLYQWNISVCFCQSISRAGDDDDDDVKGVFHFQNKKMYR